MIGSKEWCAAYVPGKWNRAAQAGQNLVSLSTDQKRAAAPHLPQYGIAAQPGVVG